MLDTIERRFHARHYVMADDKPQIPAALKMGWSMRPTTVFPRSDIGERYWDTHKPKINNLLIIQTFFLRYLDNVFFCNRVTIDTIDVLEFRICFRSLA